MIKQMGADVRKTAAVRDVYLLVLRDSKDGVVISHPQFPEKRCVLFTDNPRTFTTINNGEYTSSIFEALPLKAERAAELMRQAVTDDLNPLFLTFEENGDLIVGFIGDVRLQRMEDV